MKNNKLETLKKEEGKELTRGEKRILRAYLESADSEELIFGNMNGFFKDELEDAEILMREAGINTFVTYDSSSGLMDTVYYFLKRGCKIEAVEREGFLEIEKGLRISL